MSRLYDALSGLVGEFRARFAGRYFGRYRAIVRDVADPRRLGRVRVECPLILGRGVTSGWCWPGSGIGSNASGTPAGMFALPVVGDMVWLEFEEGNVGQPAIWSHGPWSRDAAPKHAMGAADQSEAGVKGVGIIPPSTFNPEQSGYGAVRVWQMPSGARLEFDETPDAIRVQVMHPSGSHVEMLQDGTVNIASAGPMRIQATAGDLRRFVDGNEVVTIGGAQATSMRGGRVSHIGGDDETEVKGRVVFKSGPASTTWGGDSGLEVQGTLSENVHGNEMHVVGGLWTLMVGTDVLLNAGGAASLVAMNSAGNGGLPTDLGMEVGAYNGRTLIHSRDATGQATRSSLELDGTQGSVVLGVFVAGTRVASYEAGSTGVAVTTASMVLLGSSSALEPGWLGLQAAILWNTLSGLLDAQTHTGNLGVPTGVPIVPVSPVLSPLITNAKSTTVFLE